MKFIFCILLLGSAISCGLKTAPHSQELDFRPEIPFKKAEEAPKK